jgi:hypothetical protein
MSPTSSQLVFVLEMLLKLSMLAFVAQMFPLLPVLPFVIYTTCHIALNSHQLSLFLSVPTLFLTILVEFGVSLMLAAWVLCLSSDFLKSALIWANQVRTISINIETHAPLVLSRYLLSSSVTDVICSTIFCNSLKSSSFALKLDLDHLYYVLKGYRLSKAGSYNFSRALETNMHEHESLCVSSKVLRSGYNLLSTVSCIYSTTSNRSQLNQDVSDECVSSGYCVLKLRAISTSWYWDTLLHLLSRLQSIPVGSRSFGWASEWIRVAFYCVLKTWHILPPLDWDTLLYDLTWFQFVSVESCRFWWAAAF